MSSALKTILVVDDEPVLRTIVREILLEEGYAVIEAADGAGGVASALEHEPDAVLLDLMMPGDPDGIGALARIREALPDVPVIMMSAAVPAHGLDPTIAGFMAKPFDLTQLVELVARLIGHPHANGCA